MKALLLAGALSLAPVAPDPVPPPTNTAVPCLPLEQARASWEADGWHAREVLSIDGYAAKHLIVLENGLGEAIVAPVFDECVLALTIPLGRAVHPGAGA